MQKADEDWTAFVSVAWHCYGAAMLHYFSGVMFS
jgi:hypothetical protein